MRHLLLKTALPICLVASSAAAQSTPALAPDTSWVSRATLYEVFVRDFSATGGFAGVTRGLDRIQAAGANTIWLMPIFPVGVKNRKDPLGSPYSVADYRAVNPAFGTADEFRDLVRAAHARGLKVILDWVPNHTSWDAVWVREHPEYYLRDSAGKMTVPRDEKGKLTDWTDVAQLDYDNPGLRHAMIDAMRYWLDEFGIDGFRCDVAGFVPDRFWREAIPALRRSVDRPILFLAEWGDLKMHQVGFDLTYGWDAYARLKTVWKGAPASGFVQGEVADARAMPPGGMRLRFTTNHDETAWDQPPVTLFGGTAGARAAFVAMALMPGRPLLYDGQEIESPKQLGLFTRDPIDWDRPGAAVARRFYARVMRLAGSDADLLRGPLAAVQSSAPDDVIAYRRGRLVILVNARNHAVTPSVSGGLVDGARDLLSSRIQRGNEVALPPYGAVVLEPPATGHRP